MRPRKLAIIAFVIGLSVGGLVARGESPPPPQMPAPVPGTHGHYTALTATPHRPAPFAAVDIVFGPREEIRGTSCLWWQIDVYAKEPPQGAPLMQLRVLTGRNPLEAGDARLRPARYILRIPKTGETLDYRDVHSGEALLPAWQDFERHFFPHRAAGSRRQRRMPETCTFLGHVLTLRWAGQGVAWKPWNDVRVLDLDRELLVGTGRNFKDRQGRHLPQEPKPQDYDYVAFTAEDYKVMIGAGINLFIVLPDQEKFVRGRAVFYIRGAGGEPALVYPTDLFRSNYLGATMFMDEPASIMVGDKLIHDQLRYFSDAAALVRARVEAAYNGSGSYGAYRLEKGFRDRGVNFGAMRLGQCDYPSWETMYQTAHYQMEGGLGGIIHEGRYRLEPFDAAAARWASKRRRHTPEEMLRYYFAFLRGGTRPFGKFWGTSIYGQCDPEIAKRAVTLAYDMGARYVWFWTSDHGHHVPWPEQLALSRRLREHAKAHQRKSIYGPPAVRDKAIVIPYGCLPSFENLWWVRVLDPEGKNEASVRYRRLMRNLLDAYHEALDRHEDFDFIVDSGREIKGYRKLVRVDDR